MKIDKNQVALYIVMIGLLSILSLTLWYSKPQKYIMSPGKVRYLRDSLEMEYYKRVIEESYNFDHSKIPNNESNIRIQPTR